MTALRTRALQLTMVCLAGSGLLLVLGFVGVSGSVLLGGLFIVLSVGLYATRPSSSVGPIVGIDIDSILKALWLAPLIAAVAVFLEPGATPAELQALGGLVGLVGMANYFLRPVYIFVSGFVEPETPEPP
jgi:hypothetical protein